MLIIEIAQQENGSHRNQFGSRLSIPEGWAEVPNTIHIPKTFPFVDIEAEDGVVTSMTARAVPEPEPEPPAEPSDTEVLNTLLGVRE